MSIRLVVTIKALPGKGDELARAFRERCPEVRKEPGCEHYEAFQSASDPDTLVMLERWTDQAGRAGSACESHGGSRRSGARRPARGARATRGLRLQPHALRRFPPDRSSTARILCPPHRPLDALPDWRVRRTVSAAPHQHRSGGVLPPSPAIRLRSRQLCAALRFDPRSFRAGSRARHRYARRCPAAARCTAAAFRSS